MLSELTEFIEQRFLPEGESGIKPNTPLLEWGILTSITTTELIAHIQERYGLFVPPERIVGAHFKNLDAIVQLVGSLRDDDTVASA
ncbi:acyl carrier protein [Streptomyces sp. AJS327]|nr:acyl carrier protein [Streptomyces sp. AJS327]